LAARQAQHVGLGPAKRGKLLAPKSGIVAMKNSYSCGGWTLVPDSMV
jgi:hypothetical protein